MPGSKRYVANNINSNYSEIKHYKKYLVLRQLKGNT